MASTWQKQGGVGALVLEKPSTTVTRDDSMDLITRLKNRETIFTAWSVIPDCLTVELMSQIAMDAVTMDMQHGGHHEDSVLRGIVPIQKAGKHAVVRIPVGRFDMASRALDFGAEAVIAPMINSVAEAQAFAASMKYPPLGDRSFGPAFGFPRTGATSAQEWLTTANARTLAFAMIETRKGLDVLDGILAVPGIDGIFVGPSDFSIAWTDGKSIDPTREDMIDTIADIGRRTLAAGKVGGFYTLDFATTGRFAKLGFHFQALASEHQLMAVASAVVLEKARAGLG